MKENLQKAMEFAKKIKGVKGIISISLFGSVAAGEDKRTSDIDIAVIHNRNDELALRKEVNKLLIDNIQPTFVHIEKLPSETEIAGALSGEGIILYGKTVEIKEKNIKLTPKSLLIYSLSKIEQKTKVKITRALYGYTSKFEYKGKKYMTESRGLAKELGVEKLINSVLLVERKKSFKYKNLFKRFSVPYREILVWTY